MRSLLIVGLALLLLPLGSHAKPDKKPDVYSFGVVPQFASAKIRMIWEPILDLLEKETGLRFELNGALDIPAFERSFTKGQYDFAYMNPYHAIVAHDAEGYLPIVRDVGRSLHGIIVVKKDSPYQKVTDLAGKKVAFPAPNALGAALIPRSEFSRKYDIEIKEVYVSSHSSVYLNVALGLTAAGGGVQKTFSQQPEHVTSLLRIINQTQSVAPHPVAAHQRVPEEVRKAVTDAFLKMSKTPVGQKLLSKIPMQALGETSIEDYQSLRDMQLSEFYVK